MLFCVKVVVETASKILTLVDLAGHAKYLKTTVFPAQPLRVCVRVCGFVRVWVRSCVRSRMRVWVRVCVCVMRACVCELVHLRVCAHTRENVPACACGFD